MYVELRVLRTCFAAGAVATRRRLAGTTYRDYAVPAGRRFALRERLQYG